MIDNNIYEERRTCNHLNTQTMKSYRDGKLDFKYCGKCGEILQHSHKTGGRAWRRGE